MTEYLSADRVLNTTAAGTPATRLQVRALRRIQDAVLRTVEELRESDTSAQVSHAAQALDVLLGACLDTEPSVLPPARCRRPVLVNDLRTLLDSGELDRAEVLDVRPIPHGTRHPRIFGRSARLAPGESFVLVNNHDPKPLRREFTAAHGEDFTWEYVESGRRSGGPGSAAPQSRPDPDTAAASRPAPAAADRLAVQQERSHSHCTSRGNSVGHRKSAPPRLIRPPETLPHHRVPRTKLR
ncbi:DUF2249 domain-containing protein [Amycolatopsis rubida]|uniref:Uncharacterized conserved protein n=1 Tax=Amycolatopsis rubida TaxID=112413 RepID=A0A1I5V7A2_9PSEU|nr:DUF2249 domain-containing protein [Amycolatopsis rubida]SFQ03399.1 Uncharacterized conserved protein [Amycolatopsis rubida]